MKDRSVDSKDVPKMPDSEKMLWEKIFRGNIRHLISTTGKWFSLKNLSKEVIAQEGVDQVIEKLKKGENLDSSFQPSMDFADYVVMIADDMNGLIRSGNPIKVPNYVEERLVDAQGKFSDNEEELKRIRSRLFYGRGSAQGYLVEEGSFRELPHGNKIRSLACLSAAVDFMRGDIEFGSITDYSKTIAECFGYAEMQIFQHRVVEKVMGSGTTLVFGDTLKPIPRLSTPRDPEIVDLQRRLINKLQRIM